jgi:hypothetical protein
VVLAGSLLLGMAAQRRQRAIRLRPGSLAHAGFALFRAYAAAVFAAALTLNRRDA